MRLDDYTEKDDDCPECGREYIRAKVAEDATLYIHEEKDGPMGTNLIKDSCKHEA